MGPRQSGQAIKEKDFRIPIRTCLGCGKKAPKKSLLRFVWHNLQLYQDPKGIMKGRGVYSCNNNECPALLANNPKKLARSLRRQEIKSMAKPLVIAQMAVSVHNDASQVIPLLNKKINSAG